MLIYLTCPKGKVSIHSITTTEQNSMDDAPNSTAKSSSDMYLSFSSESEEELFERILEELEEEIGPIDEDDDATDEEDEDEPM